MARGNLYKGVNKILTSKHGNKHYYKGTGSGHMGRIGTNGHAFKLDQQRVRNWMIPDLSGFKLRPLIPEVEGNINTASSKLESYFHDDTIPTQIQSYAVDYARQLLQEHAETKEYIRSITKQRKISNIVTDIYPDKTSLNATMHPIARQKKNKSRFWVPIKERQILLR